MPLRALVPRPIRSLLRQGQYFVQDNWELFSGRREPLTPPRRLANTCGPYAEVGWEFFRYHVELAGLRPEERVLDVGCGAGRMAVPLTGYLTSGSYEGFDIDPLGVRWCQKYITPRFPHFRFQLVDIYNKLYNPAGSRQASDYTFPYEDGRFDYVFLASVFTHLLPVDLQNYLQEIARVLRPGGRSLSTWFVINAEASGGMAQAGWPFVTQPGGYWTTKPETPEAAVAYDEAAVCNFYLHAGLIPRIPIYYGSWSGRAGGLCGQDIVIAHKPN